MKESFVDDLNLHMKNIVQLEVTNKIIEEYVAQGYKLTLRQLYYQLVSRDILPNTPAEYGKLSELLVKGRMAGVVDWNAIEDRLRVPFLPYWVLDIKDALKDTIDQYRLDRQEGQENYIELWVEKDALSGVLKEITGYYHINFMVNRGYSSCTAMYEAAQRFLAQEGEKQVYILYLGDHDPSGLDMLRDIEERLEKFGVEGVKLLHIGLTKEQIVEYNPPPNPCKIRDPRAKSYIQEHGNISWEVDALPPNILDKIVRENIESLIDMNLFQKRIKQEEKDKEKLREFAEEAEKRTK